MMETSLSAVKGGLEFEDICFSNALIRQVYERMEELVSHYNRINNSFFIKAEDYARSLAGKGGSEWPKASHSALDGRTSIGMPLCTCTLTLAQIQDLLRTESYARFFVPNQAPRKRTILSLIDTVYSRGPMLAAK